MLVSDALGPSPRSTRTRRARPSQPAALVIGELNVDIIAAGLTQAPELGRELEARSFEVVLGSASAIFAAGLARLGHRVAFIAKVGNDYFGRFCCDRLAALGVNTAGVAADPTSATGVTLCLSTRSDRAQVTYPGAMAQLRASDVPRDAFKGFSHLHLTCFALQKRLRPGFGKLLAAAKRQGLTTSFDPNSDLRGALRQQALRVLPHVDVLFLNEQEARDLTGKSPSAAARELSREAGCAVVKLGSKGALLARAGQLLSAPGRKVRAVDTTGAGDSFAAGFISALLAGRSDLDCLASGNACGALSTRGLGGTGAQPNQEELARFLSKPSPHNTPRKKR